MPLLRIMDAFASKIAVVVIALVGWMPAVDAVAAPSSAPVAQGGVLDLRGWNADRDDAVELRGEWRIAWDRFDDPAVYSGAAPPSTAPINVPGAWNELQVDGRAVGAHGHATYVLNVLCHDAGGLALLVPTQHAAMHLYVNGRLVVRQGQPGSSAASAQPRLNTQLVPLGAAQTCPLQIVAQVSNFSHRSGGIVRSIRLGAEALMTKQRGRNLAIDIALMSGFAVMGLLPVIFFLVRRRDATPLWFGLFCLTVALYTGFARERSLQHLFLDAGWETYLNFEYLGWYLGSPFFLLFARNLFPDEFKQRIVAGLIACVLLSSALVLLAASPLDGYSVPLVQAVTALTALYAVAAMMLATWRRRPGSYVLLGGMAVWCAVLVLDSVQYNFSFKSLATPFGILAFVLAPAFVLAQRFARALGAEELRALEQRHRVNLLVRATKAGILDWNATANEVAYSDRYKEMLGYAHDADTSDWPGFFDAVHPDEREHLRGVFLAHLRDRSVRSGRRDHLPQEFRLQHAGGHYVWVHAEAIALTDADGRVLRYICSLIDITERRQMERNLRASRDQVAAQAAQLERQNEALKENVRLREEVERISRHDLKTPLNSILAVPRLLREQHRLPREDEELLGVVERAGYRILNMVNLSLDLYKMEQGSYRFLPQAIDLLNVLNTVVADVRSHAAAKAVGLRILIDGRESGPDDHVNAWAEELLCYSIIANLLKNAVEAAPEGSQITLTLRTGDPVQLSIHNAGAVPAPMRDCFFEKYATAGKIKGTGLGTYSARLMARIQDGDLLMQTSESAGTTLTLRLRRVPRNHVAAIRDHTAEAGSASAAALADLPSARVLVVDDDEYSLLVLQRYLPNPPLHVITAINGRAALDAVATHRPDLIFMDLEMPVMDGFEATRRLRERARAGEIGRCTIVGLSSHDDAEARYRALAAGFDLYLAKPITKEALLAVVRRLVARDCGTETFAEAVPIASHPESAVVVDSDLRAGLPSFVASRRQMLGALVQASAQGDFAQARRYAHQLSGSFGLYGFHWAAERCRQIQHDAGLVDHATVTARIDEVLLHLDTVTIRFCGSANDASETDSAAVGTGRA